MRWSMPENAVLGDSSGETEVGFVEHEVTRIKYEVQHPRSITRCSYTGGTELAEISFIIAVTVDIGMSSSTAVVLSLDAELSWGFHDQETVPTERVRHARESWEYIIDLFDKYRIPATWAVVGHLFLDSCDGVHSDHPAGEEWFSRDPGGERATDSEWFGQDLIDAIRESEVDHDIGSHSFSHIEFGKQDVSKEVAEAELRYSVDAAKKDGVDLNSFVFPRNNIGYRGLLAEHDFSSYRGLSPDRWYDGTPIRPFGKLATFAIGATSPPVVNPEIDEHGLVNVPASMYLFTFEGSARDVVGTVTSDPVIKQVELGLDQLKDKKEGILHLWLHPNNITTEVDRHRLNQIVSRIAEYRDQYNISVKNMHQVANEVKNSG